MSDQNGKEQTGKPGGDSPKDLAEALRTLESERKDSSGKDRKISELLTEAKALKEQLAEAQGKATNNSAEQIARLEAMAAKAAELETMERGLSEKAQALTFALERKVPVEIAMANASRLEAFKGEVSQLADSIKAAVLEADRQAAAAGGSKPDRLRRDNPREIKERLLKGKSGLDLAAIGGLSQSEIARVPETVWKRLQNE